MANAAIATPHLLFEPGYLYWAVPGSAIPTGAVSGSVFQDDWPVAWQELGMTEAGSDFGRTLTTSPVKSAESIDPIAYRTTDRASTVSFVLMDITATNLARAMNGSSLTVTGAAGTTMTQIDPPAPGTETRCMLGFESWDQTYRYVAFQVINSGAQKMSFHKAPGTTGISWTGQLEKPATTQPFREWTAGVGRA